MICKAALGRPFLCPACLVLCRLPIPKLTSNRPLGTFPKHQQAAFYLRSVFPSVVHRMAKCIKCLLPDQVPGADIDASGTCAFCRSYVETGPAEDEAGRLAREGDLEATIKEHKGQAEYDALVCFSGGKDSIYLLYKLKVEYGLRVLAFTTDINIPEVAWKNIRRTVHKLELDHLVYRPSEQFYSKLFRYLLKNQEERGAVYTVSYVYAPLFEGDALQLAMEKGIPLVFAGYSPGQPEPERMLYEFSRELICETDWTPPQLRNCNEFSENELSRFWNPHRYPEGTEFPRYLAPFHAWEYNQGEIMNKIVELDLVASQSHASPIRSNYPINWLLMYSDLQNFGYNPYIPEFSALIREGKASLSYWKVMQPIVDFMIRRQILLGRDVKRSLDWLGLSTDELKITLPKGVYAPPIISSGNN